MPPRNRSPPRHLRRISRCGICTARSVVRLADLRGKAVLLNFWATWCPPCVAEIPTLIELHRLRGDDLVILGISVDAIDHGHSHDGGAGPEQHSSEDRAAEVKRFAEQHGVPYPVLMDDDGRTTAAYAAEGLPTTILIDRQGYIRRRFIGPRTLHGFQAMVDEIEPKR